MNIGVIGGGVVGRATARCWLEHCDEVRVWDKLQERSTHNFFDALNSDIVFICLPESELDYFFTEFPTGEGWKNGNYVLKSTVPIGTTRRLRDQYYLPNLVHSPEFLTARCAVTDAQVPARNIIGIPNYNSPSPTKPSSGFWESLLGVYKNRFPGVSTFIMSSDESEAVKLAVNSFFSVKVAFFNEVRSLCDALKLNWETVREGILSDGRICSSHTQVPGPDGNRGFGGTCLPKDICHFVDAFLSIKHHQAVPIMAVAALKRNDMLDRRKS